MTEDAITQHLIDMLSGGHFEVADDNTFFFHGADKKRPFATILTKDSEVDSASTLNRPGLFRLDVGVGRQSFQSLFGEHAPAAVDFAAIDTLMPHPVHAATYWVSVINPSARTFDTVKPLIARALELAASADPEH